MVLFVDTNDGVVLGLAVVLKVRFLTGVADGPIDVVGSLDALVGMEEGVCEGAADFSEKIGELPFTGTLDRMEVGIRVGAREGIVEGFRPVEVGA